MGWFWGSWTSSSGDKDPTKSLDPDLKSFLDSSQPSPYTPTSKVSPAFTRSTTREGPPAPPPPPPPPPDTNASSDRPLPKESLFQDGRYAYLWKTYQPQAQAEEESTHPTTRIYNQFKDRKNMINDAAMENCAVEAEASGRCFEFGDWRDRLWARATMCHKEKQELNRCYTLQAKFLQALGYLADPSVSDERQEAIQMHADKLYHKMLDYEKSVEAARAAGQPEPPLTSIFNSSHPLDVEKLNIPKGAEKQIKTPLKDLPPWERELQVAAVKGELAQKKVMAEQLSVIVNKETVDRNRRRKWVSDNFGETIGQFAVPDVETQKKDS